MAGGAYTVTQMNTYIKNMFRQDFVLSRVSVKGEISNCKYHTSGHIYFTLKDSGGTLSAVMFAGQAKNLSMHLENGMQVVAGGRIDVYERDGRYQLYAASVELDGVGAWYLRYEALKQKFEEMGYFSGEYKRAIPRFSRTVGIVTASTGAAVHDICNISYRRNPYVQLVLYPALVQGAGAADSIVRGIRELDKMGLDVLIVGRGGGSIEDLWAFNEERVVEAVFNTNTPVISAVGHETDFTLTDFAADLRAPTPSAAAELAVADITLVEGSILDYAMSLYAGLGKKLDSLRSQAEQYALKLKFLNPVSQAQEKRQKLMQLEDALEEAFLSILKDRRHRLELASSRLNGVSPLARLGQGNSYTQRADGSRISSVRELKAGDELDVYLRDGRVRAKTMEVLYGENTDA